MHAFSLPARDLPPAARSDCGLPDELGELWSTLDGGEVIGCEDDPARLAVRAKAYFEVVSAHLLALSDSPQVRRSSALRCAALALELSARVWGAFGPAAGRRQLHLWHRLQDSLAATDRQVRAAELPLRVNRATLPVAAANAGAAIDDLLAGERDVAEALAALEDAAVAVAALAVRIATSTSSTSGAGRVQSVRPPGLEEQLGVLAAQASLNARDQLAAAVRNGSGDHVGWWLSAALALSAPIEAIELSTSTGADIALRREALYSLRARWLELGGALWGIVRALDELLTVATFDDDARLQRLVSVRAEKLLVACDLCRRPGAFDHREAWRQQRDALCELVSDVCVALESRDMDAVLASQQLAVRRLMRVLPAIWVIDEVARRPIEADGRERR